MLYALLIIILVLLAVYVLLTLCLYTIFWYETINNPSEILHQPKATFSNIIYRIVCFWALHAFRPFYFLFWLSTKRNHSPLMAEHNLEYPPIVLVHGLYDTPSSWLFVTRRLQKAGFRVITFQYNSFFADFDAIVSDFDNFLYLAEASFPGQRLLLVGHSMGGIVIRRWLTKQSNEKRTAGVITLSTPHKGSKVAVFGPGKLAKNLLPIAPLMQELAAAPPISVPCIAFASAVDELVLPSDSLLPPDGWKLYETEPTSHLGMLFRKNICEKLITVLQEFKEKELTIEEALLNAESNQQTPQDNAGENAPEPPL